MRLPTDMVSQDPIMGIDPGQSTGIAILRGGVVAELKTVRPDDLAALICDLRPRLVVYEDSRPDTMYPRAGAGERTMMHIARCVGQIDLQCRDIEELCAREGIECLGVTPNRKGRKRNAAQFAALTGWTGRSNRHTRDAGVIAWPFRRGIAPSFVPHKTRRRGGKS